MVVEGVGGPAKCGGEFRNGNSSHLREYVDDFLPRGRCQGFELPSCTNNIITAGAFHCADDNESLKILQYFQQ